MVFGIKMFGSDTSPSDQGEKAVSEDRVEIVEKPSQIQVYQSEDGLHLEETEASRAVVVHPQTLIIPPEVREEMKREAEGKENFLSVPALFETWFQEMDKSLSVRKAYHLIDQLEESQPALYEWVSENEDTFAKVWLGAPYRVREVPRYEVSIPVEGSRPNFLAKQADGFVLFKPYAALLDDDETELTEEDVLPEWRMFFTEQYARLVNPDKI